MSKGALEIGGPVTIAEAGAGIEITFLPAKGDRVEFDSDRQTEKGPSSGTVTAVNYDEGWCIIQHSDHPGERFTMGNVEVKRYRRNKTGPDRGRYWLLA